MSLNPKPSAFKRCQPPLYSWALKPTSIGCITAAVLAIYPPSLDLGKFLPGSPRPLTVRAYVALVGLILGFGFAKGLDWTRKALLRRLFADQGWMHHPKSTRTKIWALLVKLLKGPRPYSTYEFQRMLPNQPLPALDQTLDLWLSVNGQWLSEEELTCTKQAVDNFRKNEGPKLQRHLEERAAKEVSWLHEYWLVAAYLASRDPLPIASNYFNSVSVPRARSADQLAVAATGTLLFAQFAEMIDSETLNPVELQGLVPLCMNGFKSVFNTVRVPGENMDNVVRHTGHRHVVVIRKGQYFTFEVSAPATNSRKKSLLSAREIKRQLERVVQMSDESTERCEVAALTTQNRTQWAKHREILRKSNQDTLQTLESALFHLVLDDYIPKDESELCWRLDTGTGSDRWFDKGVTSVSFGDGQYGHNVEHSALDATVFVTLSEYHTLYEDYAPDGDVLEDPDCPRHDLITPKRLTWNVKELETEISTALTEYKTKLDDFGVIVVIPPYGKGFMKKQRFSPDGYIQMAIQLAFYRLHKTLAKTYEPSTGRIFALGRTETVHVMSTYSEQWVKSMDDSSASPETKRQLLKKAIECQTNFRLKAATGQACDRHLLGLFMASRELGMDVPQIFMDKAWRSPYMLSTSQTPSGAFDYAAGLEYKEVNGGFGPHSKDGYGISYVIHGDDMINFSMTAYKSSEVSNLQKFGQSLVQGMEDMRNFLKS